MLRQELNERITDSLTNQYISALVSTVIVARFDAKAVALVDTEALARLLLRAEAVASSKIEGLEVGRRRLLAPRRRRTWARTPAT